VVLAWWLVVVLAWWLVRLEMSVDLSSLRVSNRWVWWWPCLAVKTTARDGRLMLQAAVAAVVLEKKREQ